VPVKPVERRLTRFLREPPSVWNAVRVIVAVTVLSMVAAGILMRVLDHDEFPTVWLGMWWALQTITSVGYGDVVPHTVPGRIIAALVMLQGIAFLTVVVAAITSTFVERVRLEHLGERAERHGISEQELIQRLERIEALLKEMGRR